MRSIHAMAVGATLVAITALASPAGAEGRDVVQVRGVQRPADPAIGSYTMSGDLVGDWYTTSFEVRLGTPSGAIVGSGTEVFVGCYDADSSADCGGDDPTGTISFSFTYTGRFDPATGALRHGRCHHPVTGGTGDFADASGVLTFHDDPSGCSEYRGQLSW